MAFIPLRESKYVKAHVPADRPSLRNLLAVVAQDAPALGQSDDHQPAAPSAAPSNPSAPALGQLDDAPSAGNPDAPEAMPGNQLAPLTQPEAPLAPPLGSQVSALSITAQKLYSSFTCRGCVFCNCIGRPVAASAW